MQSKLQYIYDQFLKNPNLTIDSRSVKKGDLFFAIRGDHFNGNDFALKSLELGASLAIVDDPGLKGKDGCYYVKDVLTSLQELAKHHRRTLDTKIIGITGSNGKTTTKELIAAVLKKNFRTIATKGNFNNHIGVPLTLLSIPQDTDFAVIEMGANHPGEIALLCNIAQPDFGIITNIGKAHLEGFGSFEGVIRTKSELYDFLRQCNRKAFVNIDNPILVSQSKGLDAVTYGSQKQVYCAGELIKSFPYVDLLISVNNSRFEVKSRITGKYNFENILAAICIGSYFGVTPEIIQEAIFEYIPANNRSQILQSGSNTIILDAYNANPTSMKAAIDNFKESNYKNKVLILGEMLELGDVSHDEHAEIVKYTKSLDFSDAFLVGNGFKEAGTHFGKWFNSTDELKLYLKKNPIFNSTILIKGSRGNALERIIDFI